MRYLLSVILFVFSISNAHALEIGVVDLNRALNESEEGMRSKNLLESRGRQKQQEFKVEEEELMQIAEDLRNNPLLTPKAKQEKEQELQNRQRILREKVRQFEQELRLEERKLTEAIFQDLKAAIRTVENETLNFTVNMTVQLDANKLVDVLSDSSKMQQGRVVQLAGA